MDPDFCTLVQRRVSHLHGFLFPAADIACPSAWGGNLLRLRPLLGVGVGVIHPVTLTIINFLIGSERRGAANSTFFTLFDYRS